MFHRRALALCVSLTLVLGMVAIAGAEPPEDPLGVVAIKKGEPIHIAYWLVVAGPDASRDRHPRAASNLRSRTKAGSF